MQRCLDVFFSGLALIFFAPLLIAVMIVLKLTGEHEVFFLQSRVGKDGKQFNLFKFVTMQKNSESIGTGTITLKNDPRVLPVGRILRKLKINELPQLINVFIGDMSVIGPRPQTPRCFAAFPAEIQSEIVKIRPGLSSVAAVIFRNEEGLLHNADDSVRFYDQVIAPYKGELEKWYVHNQTIKNYFLIIIITVWAVLFHQTKIIWSVFKTVPRPPRELEMLSAD